MFTYCHSFLRIDSCCTLLAHGLSALFSSSDSIDSKLAKATYPSVQRTANFAKATHAQATTVRYILPGYDSCQVFYRMNQCVAGVRALLCVLFKVFLRLYTFSLQLFVTSVTVSTPSLSCSTCSQPQGKHHSLTMPVAYPSSSADRASVFWFCWLSNLPLRSNILVPPQGLVLGTS